MDLIVTIYHAGALTVLFLILFTLLANMIFIPVLREQVNCSSCNKAKQGRIY